MIRDFKPVQSVDFETYKNGYSRVAKLHDIRLEKERSEQRDTATEYIARLLYASPQRDVYAGDYWVRLENLHIPRSIPIISRVITRSASITLLPIQGFPLEEHEKEFFLINNSGSILRPNENCFHPAPGNEAPQVPAGYLMSMDFKSAISQHIDAFINSATPDIPSK